MVKDTNIQKSIVIPKEIDEKIKREAEELYTSSNCVIRKILTDYYKEKEVNRKAQTKIDKSRQEIVEEILQDFDTVLDSTPYYKFNPINMA